MFAPAASSQITSKSSKTPTGETIIEFEACFRANSLGPSPQGRLQISTIRTPIARRDSGAFDFKIYKDSAYTSLIVALQKPGVIIKAADLAPGKVTNIKI